MLRLLKASFRCRRKCVRVRSDVWFNSFQTRNVCSVHQLLKIARSINSTHSKHYSLWKILSTQEFNREFFNVIPFFFLFRLGMRNVCHRQQVIIHSVYSLLRLLTSKKLTEGHSLIVIKFYLFIFVFFSISFM